MQLALRSAGRSVAPVEVLSYDAQTRRDTLVQKTGGPVSTDEVARTAYDNAVKVVEYYKNTFGRDSYDNRGSVVSVRVHAPNPNGSTPANNAYWRTGENRMHFGDGDGTVFSPLGAAVDVVAHEFTHGVIYSEVDLSGGGQEGGLHESFSDVLATGLDNNWQLGESVYTPGTSGDAVRDLANPLYKNMKDVPAWADEPHDLASIPNHAAYKVALQIGGDAMRKIWYQALTDDLRAHSGYGGAAQATLAAALRIHGEGSKELAAVRDAWAAVGVSKDTPKVKEQTAAQKFSVREVALVPVGVSALDRAISTAK